MDDCYMKVPMHTNFHRTENGTTQLERRNNLQQSEESRAKSHSTGDHISTKNLEHVGQDLRLVD